ncbi:MAG: hypothetical protein L0Z62_22660 [Gemmataceae bacterium]|nr:hypothetical protein [Gemmataceae bacterium]
MPPWLRDFLARPDLGLALNDLTPDQIRVLEDLILERLTSDNPRRLGVLEREPAGRPHRWGISELDFGRMEVALVTGAPGYWSGRLSRFQEEWLAAYDSVLERGAESELTERRANTIRERRAGLRPPTPNETASLNWLRDLLRLGSLQELPVDVRLRVGNMQWYLREILTNPLAREGIPHAHLVVVRQTLVDLARTEYQRTQVPPVPPEVPYGFGQRLSQQELGWWLGALGGEIDEVVRRGGRPVPARMLTDQQVEFLRDLIRHPWIGRRPPGAPPDVLGTIDLRDYVPEWRRLIHNRLPLNPQPPLNEPSVRQLWVDNLLRDLRHSRTPGDPETPPPASTAAQRMHLRRLWTSRHAAQLRADFTAEELELLRRFLISQTPQGEWLPRRVLTDAPVPPPANPWAERPPPRLSPIFDGPRVWLQPEFLSPPNATGQRISSGLHHVVPPATLSPTFEGQPSLPSNPRVVPGTINSALGNHPPGALASAPPEPEFRLPQVRRVGPNIWESGGRLWRIDPETGRVQPAPDPRLPPSRGGYHGGHAGVMGAMAYMGLHQVVESVRAGDPVGVGLGGATAGTGTMGMFAELVAALRAARAPAPAPGAAPPPIEPAAGGRFSRAIVWLAVINAARNTFLDFTNAPPGSRLQWGLQRAGAEAAPFVGGWVVGSLLGGGTAPGAIAAAARVAVPFAAGFGVAMGLAQVLNTAVDAARLYQMGETMFRPRPDFASLSQFAHGFSRSPSLRNARRHSDGSLDLTDLDTLDRLEQHLQAHIRLQELQADATDTGGLRYSADRTRDRNRHNHAIMELRVMRAALEELRQLRAAVRAHQDQWVGQARLPAGNQFVLAALNVVAVAAEAEQRRREEMDRRRAEVDRRMAIEFEVRFHPATAADWESREYWRRFYEISREVGYEITDPGELRMIERHVPRDVRRSINRRISRVRFRPNFGPPPTIPQPPGGFTRGGGGEGGTVESDCSDELLPETLHATVSDKTGGCTCLPDSFELVWNESEGVWEKQAPLLCSGSFGAELECTESPVEPPCKGFSLTMAGVSQPPSTFECDPLDLLFEMTLTAGCSGSANVRITE